MSAKDLCALPFLDKLKKTGIVSFKIEGRNRDARYVQTVVKEYKKAIDKDLSKEEIKRSIEKLNKVYTKGFSSGFYLGVPTNDDFSDVENSKATTKKEFIGLVKHYYSKAKVGEVIIQTGKLKIGDEVAIMGNNTGIKSLIIESMEIKNKKITEAKKGQEVGIKLPRVRKNDEVYKIIQDKN
jgi:U32 family peptidase